jgi:hypothetical protein
LLVIAHRIAAPQHTAGLVLPLVDWLSLRDDDGRQEIIRIGTPGEAIRVRDAVSGLPISDAVQWSLLPLIDGSGRNLSVRGLVD